MSAASAVAVGCTSAVSAAAAGGTSAASAAAAVAVGCTSAASAVAMGCTSAVSAVLKQASAAELAQSAAETSPGAPGAATDSLRRADIAAITTGTTDMAGNSDLLP